jgi:hypothetical protein
MFRSLLDVILPCDVMLGVECLAFDAMREIA